MATEDSSGADTKLHIRVLDGHRFRTDLGREFVFRSRKADALIGILALTENHKLSRDELEGMIWSDHGRGDAAKELRLCVRSIKDVLEGVGFKGFVENNSEIALLPNSITVDIETLLRDVTRGEMFEQLVHGSELRERLLIGFESIGPLYNSWLQSTRNHWKRRLISELTFWMHNSAPERAILAARAVIRNEDTDEAAHCFLMQTYAKQGRIHKALSQYDQLSKLLDEKYDLEPEDRTQELYRQIRDGFYPDTAASEEPPFWETEAGRDAKSEPQNPVSIRFKTDSKKPIEPDYSHDLESLLDTEESSDRYNETKRLTDAFITQFDPEERGANAVAAYIGNVTRYLDALGETIQTSKPGLFVPRGDALRQILKAQQDRDEFSDLPELTDKYMLALGQLVSAHNAFVSLDPELAARDEALLDPDALAALISPDEGQRVIQDAVDEGAATQETVDVMAEEAKVAPAEPVAGSRTSRRYSEGVKNFARATLSQALSFAKWGWKHKGKLAAGSVGTVTGSYFSANWVLANEAWFLITFAKNPAMLDFVTKLIQFLKTLPLA